MAVTSNAEFHVAIVSKISPRDLQIEHSVNVFTGAGIGGLALAMALHKKDISFTLYEDAKEFFAVMAVSLSALFGMKVSIIHCIVTASKKGASP